MSGLALIAQRLGAEVSGCDRAESAYIDELRAAGHRAARSATTPRTLCRASSWSSRPRSRTTPGARGARASAARRSIHRGELLAEVAALRRVIAVSGTHGKTTTTAMIAHALAACGLDPRLR